MGLSKYKLTNEAILSGVTKIFVTSKNKFIVFERMTEEEAEYLFKKKSRYIELVEETAKTDKK